MEPAIGDLYDLISQVHKFTVARTAQVTAHLLDAISVSYNHAVHHPGQSLTAVLVLSSCT